MSIERNNTAHAPLSRIYDIYTSHAFYEARYKRSGINNYTINRFDKHEDECHIEITLESSIEVPSSIPSPARSLVPKTQTVIYQASWKRVDDDRMEAEYIYKTPEDTVEVKGKRTLISKDGATQNTTLFETDCRIPLFGQLLAGFIEQRIEKECESDHIILSEFLDNTQN